MGDYTGGFPSLGDGFNKVCVTFTAFSLTVLTKFGMGVWISDTMVLPLALDVSAALRAHVHYPYAVLDYYPI